MALGLRRLGPATLLALATVAAIAAGLYGLAEIFTLPNDCELSRMYPNYIPMAQPPGATDDRYRLFFYAEGFAPTAAELTPGMPGGVPILFVHGNAGDYMQVRSLAAESYWQRAGSGPGAPRLDWYTADFREEMSALDGGLTRRQAAYVVACVGAILAGYTGHGGLAPTQVHLVGHSMGAVVAMLAAPSAPVRLVVTLAGPHASLPLITQPAMAGAYATRDRTWDGGASPAVADTVVVSLAGGIQDTMVPERLTALDGVVSTHRSVLRSCPHLVGVQLAIDHQALLWCKQLVTRTVAALLDVAADDARVGAGAAETPAAAATRRRRLLAAALSTVAAHGNGFEALTPRSASPPAAAAAASLLLAHAGRLPSLAAAACAATLASLHISGAAGRPASVLSVWDNAIRRPWGGLAAAATSLVLGAGGGLPTRLIPLLPGPIEAVALAAVGMGVLVIVAAVAATAIVLLPPPAPTPAGRTGITWAVVTAVLASTLALVSHPALGLIVGLVIAGRHTARAIARAAAAPSGRNHVSESSVAARSLAHLLLVSLAAVHATPAAVACLHVAKLQGLWRVPLGFTWPDSPLAALAAAHACLLPWGTTPSHAAAAIHALAACVIGAAALCGSGEATAYVAGALGAWGLVVTAIAAATPHSRVDRVKDG